MVFTEFRKFAGCAKLSCHWNSVNTMVSWQFVLSSFHHSPRAYCTIFTWGIFQVPLRMDGDPSVGQ